MTQRDRIAFRFRLPDLVYKHMRSFSKYRYTFLVVAILCVGQFGAVVFANEADAQSVSYGHFEVTLTPAQLLDQSTLDSVSEVIGADEEITWKMYVPESYNEKDPAGLMVYISPNSKGWMPRKWRTVIDEENLIWIGANDSGNDAHTARRMLYAALAPQIAEKKYRIDADRVYLSGFSGGGKVASMVSIDFANVFKGAIYICGTEFWRKHPPKLFQQVKTNRYVFLSGREDFNLGLTYEIYRKYQDAGLRNIKMMEIPRMRHSNPDARNFRKAINFLDERE